MMKYVLVCAVLVSPQFTAPAPAEDLKTAARALRGKYQDAIIQVKLTVKVGSLDQQAEVAGTVISPQGLTVVSDLSTNPRALFGSDEGGGGRAETTDVKLVLKDGKEIPGTFVLRDRDLDVAFIMPKDKGLNLTCVKFEKAPIPEVLDDLVFLHRLGKSLNREVSIVLSRAEAVVRKPRVLIVPDVLTGLQKLGCPVFDAAGRPVGLVVMRRGPGGAGGGIFGAMQPVIVTAEELMQVAGQVEKPAEDGK